MRSGDDNCVKGSRMDHLLPAAENLQPLLAILFQFMRRGTGHGDKFAPLDFAIQQILSVKTPHVSHSDDTDPYFCHFANNLISKKGINQETSGATWAQTEDFHHVGYLGVAEALGHFLQFIPHAQIDSFSTSALSAAEVMMVAMAVSQAINFRSVFALRAQQPRPFRTVRGNDRP